MSTRGYIRVSAQLLASAGLLHFARGSISSREQEVSYPRVIDARDVLVGQMPAQTLKGKDTPSASPDTTAVTTGLAIGDGRTVLDASREQNRMLHSKTIPTLAVDRRRKLQVSQESTCETSVSVTSSIFPLLEGCLTLTVVDGFETAYVSDTGFVGYGEPTIPQIEGYDAGLPRWAAYFHENPWENYEIGCLSFEDGEEVDASEATWLCDADGDGFVETYAYQGEELSVFCGCSFPSSSPSNPSAPTPSPFTPAPTPSGHDICGEGGSVSVISESLPEAAGCLFSTTTTLDGYALYTSDGTDDEEQLWMYDLEITREDSSTAVVWALVYMKKRFLTGFYDMLCRSTVEAALYDPWEVPVWECNGEGGIPGTSSVTFSSDSSITIDVECSCSGSSSPETPSPIFSRAPAPFAPPTTGTTTEPASPPAPSADTDDDNPASTDTCPGDGSFTVSASAASILDGCFEEVNFSTGGSTVVYTVSGTSDTAEFVVSPVEGDSGDFNWHIVSMPSGADSSAESQTYCISDELSSDVNPADASWNCDFTGEGDSFLAATEENIAIVCGSCTTVVPEGDSNSASKFSFGFITSACAGVVAVGAVFSSWYE